MPQFPTGKPERFLLLTLGLFLALVLTYVLIAVVLAQFGAVGKVLAGVFVGTVLARWAYNIFKSKKKDKP